MGRKRKILTPEEQEERKQRWWGADRNARRRERYQQDKQYREKTIQQVREGYRRNRAEDGLDVREDDCIESLPKLPQIGQIREVRITDEQTVRLLTFTVDEVAVALTRNQQVLYRWIKADLLPPPAFEARNFRNRWQAVYTVPEVRAMIEVFSEHQKLSQYYRSYHEETRAKFFSAVLAARDKVQKGALNE